MCSFTTFDIFHHFTIVLQTDRRAAQERIFDEPSKLSNDSIWLKIWKSFSHSFWLHRCLSIYLDLVIYFVRAENYHNDDAMSTISKSNLKHFKFQYSKFQIQYYSCFGVRALVSLIWIQSQKLYILEFIAMNSEVKFCIISFRKSARRKIHQERKLLEIVKWNSLSMWRIPRYFLKLHTSGFELLNWSNDEIEMHSK